MELLTGPKTAVSDRGYTGVGYEPRSATAGTRVALVTEVDDLGLPAAAGTRVLPIGRGQRPRVHGLPIIIDTITS